MDINLYKKKFYKLSQSYITSRVLMKLTWVDLNLVCWAKTINIGGCWKKIFPEAGALLERNPACRKATLEEKIGSTEIWTRVTGFRVQCPYH